MELEATVAAMEQSNVDPTRPIRLTLTLPDDQPLSFAITRKEAKGLYPGMQVRISIRKIWGVK